MNSFFVLSVFRSCLGVFFILFALWWHVNNCIHYLRSLVSETERPLPSPMKFRGSTTYSCRCLPSAAQRRAPVESSLKVLITSIHFTIELATGYNSQPTPHIGDENAHHTAMLFGFFLGAWVEILAHLKVPLPKRTTQVMGFLAFAIEALMMVFHLHARTTIDAHTHQLLGLTIVCSVIGALAECCNPHSFWLIVARSYFALTQGTWFIQAAYVLWPKTSNPLFLWDPESHRSVSLLTMSYAYHLAGNAFVLVLIYLLIYLVLSPRVKLNADDIEDDEAVSDYKLILDVNDEENCI